jgi:hypothetical protein
MSECAYDPELDTTALEVRREERFCGQAIPTGT